MLCVWSLHAYADAAFHVIDIENSMHYRSFESVDSIFQFVFSFFVTLISSFPNKLKFLYSKLKTLFTLPFFVMEGSTHLSTFSLIHETGSILFCSLYSA